jgi:uncharacterized integral membrane protein
MKLIKAIVYLLLFFFALTFCLQNFDEVTIRYRGLIDDFTAPLFAVVLAAAFLGAAIGLIGGGLSSVRLRMQLRKLAHDAEDLKNELTSAKGHEKRKEKEKKAPDA